MRRLLRALISVLVVVLLVIGAAVAIAPVRALSLSDVVEVRIEPWGSSCGLRLVEVPYRGETYIFDLSDGQDVYPPESWLFIPSQWMDGNLIRVGTRDGQVWAVAPDGGLWKLIVADEAALFCL